MQYQMNVHGTVPTYEYYALHPIQQREMFLSQGLNDDCSSSSNSSYSSNDSGFTCDCWQPFSEYYPLAKKAKKIFNGQKICVGYKRLFMSFDEDARSIIKSYILTHNNHTINPFQSINDMFMSDEKLINKYAKKEKKAMSSRRKEVNNARDTMTSVKCGLPSKDESAPSTLEIVDMIKKSNGVCAITGVPGVWAADNTHPFRLSWDHIVRISKGGSFGIENIQIVLHCINQLKSDESDSEVIRFSMG